MIARRAALCAVTAVLFTACPRSRPRATGDAPADSARVGPVGEEAVRAPESGDPDPGDWVHVVASHPLGVPLHPGERAQEVSGRLPDGTRVKVLARSADGRWLEVLAKTGQRGWITTRYAPELEAREEPEAIELAPGSVFRSKDACESLVAKRRAARNPGNARIMSYNVRHFPDGAGSDGTDVEWLACVVASSNADLVLVQEFKNRRHAAKELDTLLGRLDVLSQGRWAAAFDECPGAMHVGVLYDASRVDASSLGTFPTLNPHGDACKNQLRPGFGGYFRFPGGFDAHVISVHLKSASTRRALELRRQSLAGLAAAVAQAQKSQADRDVIVAGDLNSMGCRKCSPELDSAQEIAELDALLEKTRPAFRRVRARPSCSHYYHGDGSLLDHFLVTTSLTELDPGRFVTVSGYCGELSCKSLGQRREPSAYRRLSDHCPVVLDISDRDLD